MLFRRTNLILHSHIFSRTVYNTKGYVYFKDWQIPAATRRTKDWEDEIKSEGLWQETIKKQSQNENKTLLGVIEPSEKVNKKSRGFLYAISRKKIVKKGLRDLFYGVSGIISWNYNFVNRLFLSGHLEEKALDELNSYFPKWKKTRT